MDELERTLEQVRSYEKRDSDAAVRRWAARRARCEAQTQRVCRQEAVAIAGPVPPALAVQHATTLLDRWKWRKAQVCDPHFNTALSLTHLSVTVAATVARELMVVHDVRSHAARRASLRTSVATDARVCARALSQCQSSIDALDSKLKQLNESFAQGEVIDRWTPGVVVPFKHV
jgi:hypothetical protein